RVRRTIPSAVYSATPSPQKTAGSQTPALRPMDRPDVGGRSSLPIQDFDRAFASSFVIRPDLLQSTIISVKQVCTDMPRHLKQLPEKVAANRHGLDDLLPHDPILAWDSEPAIIQRA